MPDKPFFMYFAPGRHARAAPRAEGVDRQVQGQVRPRLGRAARGHVRAAEGARRDPGRRRADAAARRDPGLGRHGPRAEAGARAPDGGLRRLHGAHRPPRRPADRRDRGARRARRHARLRDHRRQRRLGRGHAQGRLQRDGQLQRHGRARDARVHGCRSSTSSARPTSYNHYAVGWAWAMDTPYQWTKQVASHWGGTRNGTIVRWPNGITEKGEIREPVHATSSTSPRRSWRPPACPSRRWSTACSSARSRAPACSTASTTPSARAARPAVLRDVRQPRHLLQGLERGDQAPHAVAHGRRRRARVRRRRLGALRRQHATGRRRGTWRRRCPTSSTSCSGCG